MDFTLKKYRQLLRALQDNGYRFLTFEQYCCQKADFEGARFVILRHDVDMKADNLLDTARIEAELGMKASYYFGWCRRATGRKSSGTLPLWSMKSAIIMKT